MQLEQAVANHTVRAAPFDPLTHLLLAVVNESALYVANSTNRDLASTQARAAIDLLLDGLHPG